MNKELKLLAENCNVWPAKFYWCAWTEAKNTCQKLIGFSQYGTSGINSPELFCKSEWQAARQELGLDSPFTSPEEDEAWADAERRMDTIGQNGNTAEHYDEPPEREKYGAYHKDVRRLDSIDVYETHRLFAIDDPSGCLQHASKKLLLSGVRTGGKTKLQDIEEARDTLNRWVEMERGV
jgi:hypothetical protein